MVDLSIALFRNLSPLAFVALAYSFILRQADPRLHGALVGLLFGLGAVVTMLDPIEVRPGVLIDSRTTMIVLAGYFAGPVGGLLSAAIAGALRLYLGGAGALGGCILIAIAAAIGLFGHRHLRNADGQFCCDGLLILALLSPLVALGAFALPWDTAVRLLGETIVPTSFIRVVGTLALGIIIQHEHGRFVAERRIRELASTDELSGLGNRRAFYSRLESETNRQSRYRTPFSVLLIDIDRFKSINDTFGHAQGDEVIRRMARILKDECRASDMPSRIGGEEFAVLLADTEPGFAHGLAERIRRAAAAEVIATGKGPVSFTISIGIGSDHLQGRQPDAIMSAADDALYRSKETGRNRVSVAAATAACA